MVTKAVEKYGRGELSLSEAAAFASVSIPEMMDILSAKGINSNYSLKDAEDSLKNIGKLSKR